jgi:Putative transposase DNA-binding domain
MCPASWRPVNGAQAGATAADRISPGEPCDQFHDLAETSEKQIPEKDTKVKVYSYACKISHPMDAALVEHQMTLSHRHRNVLTEALIEWRKRYRQIIKEHLGLDIKGLEEKDEELTGAIDSIYQEIADWKKENRTRKTNPELAEKLQELKAKRKLVRDQVKAVKVAAKEDPALKPLIEETNLAVDAAIKETRNHYSNKRGLYWPNYLENERSAKLARFQPMDPKFRRWTGDGSLAIQFQGGLTRDELFDCKDTRLRLVPPSESAVRARGQVRGQGRHVRALYRVQSNEDGSPRWIALNVTMHRMLPTNGVLKWAHLQRDKSSSSAGKTYISLTRDYDYTLRLTVAEPMAKPAAPVKVAIEIGWRLFKQGLRVAVALGEDGKFRELYLPTDWLEGKRKAESLLSIIDRETNGRVKDHQGVPSASLRGTCLGGSNGRKLASALLRLWRAFPSLRPSLEHWRKQHFHLLRYERGLRQSLNRARRDLYRNFVSELAKTYSICGIEEFDLRTFTRKDAAKDAPPDLAKWHRTVASLSSLTALLKQRMLTQKLSAHNTTRKCHNCGLVEEWNSAAKVWHRCSNCQSRWDRDYNSAQNLLDLLCESYDKQKELSARESERIEDKDLQRIK